MKSVFAVVRWELRLMRRLPRTWVVSAAYLLLGALPLAVLVFLSRWAAYGAASYFAQVSYFQPFLTALLAALLGAALGSGNHAETMRPVLGNSPMSSSRYLLGRWLARLVLILPLTLLPLAAAMAVASFQGGALDPRAPGWFWLLMILPLAAGVSAAWLGAVTALRGEVAAFAVLVLGSFLLLQGLNDYVLAQFSVTLGTLASWIGLPAFSEVEWLTAALTRNSPDYWAPYFVATEAPYDVRTVFDWIWPRSVLGLGACTLFFGLGTIFVDRGRRDVPPLTLRDDHPLRSILPRLQGLRLTLTPSAGLGRSERLAVAAGAAVFLLCLGLGLGRASHFRSLGDERYAAETGDPIPPMPEGVEAGNWKVEGSVALDGHVGTSWDGTLQNNGAGAVDRLAFSLDEGLRVVELRADGRTLETTRAWDRLEVRLTPPLAAGETLRLRGRFAGEPGHMDWHMLYYNDDTFTSAWERQRNSTWGYHLSDLSWSRRVLAVSPRRIALVLPQLVPVPRRTPWTLARVEKEDTSRQPKLSVPAETSTRELDLELDLRLPAGVHAADVCGSLSTVDGGAHRLRGRCRASLSLYYILGGAFEVVRDDGVSFAVLPSHRERVEELRRMMAEAVRLSDQAWPGLPGLGSEENGLVVMERLDAFDPPMLRVRGWFGGGDVLEEQQLNGRLLSLHELSVVLEERRPRAEALVARALSRDLIGRREVDAEQSYLIRQMVEALMVRRMGLGQQADARASGPPWLHREMSQPLLTLSPFMSPLNLKRIRLPAVLADLEGRVGARALYESVDALLTDSGNGEPATVEDLFVLLEKTSGTSLQRFYDDFIAGQAIPELGLADATVQRNGRGYKVSGKVRNTGTGEVRCPVLVKTAVSTAKVLVTVGSKAEVPFTVVVDDEPHTVFLDPDGTCHRLVGPNAATAERADLRL